MIAPMPSWTGASTPRVLSSTGWTSAFGDLDPHAQLLRLRRLRDFTRIFYHRQDYGQAARRHPCLPGPSFQAFLYLRRTAASESRKTSWGKGSIWESSSRPRPSGSEAFCSMSTVFLLRRSDGALDA